MSMECNACGFKLINYVLNYVKLHNTIGSKSVTVWSQGIFAFQKCVDRLLESTQWCDVEPI